MDINDKQLRVSATDLAKHLACRHATSLDLRAVHGEIQRVYRDDPSLAALTERGFRHELAYMTHLKGRGLAVLDEDSELAGDARITRTIQGMRAGVDGIAQADLWDGNWRGRADVLLKVDRPSALGNWSYEVVDTKLARETRGGSILQLCLYSELVGKIQGSMPVYAHVVTPGRDFNPETFRLADFLAYYRYVKSRLETTIHAETREVTYPAPVEHCDICQWWPVCNDRRREDDHLSFVAGISKLQIEELRRWEVTTLKSLAAMPVPLQNRPERGGLDGYVRVREQARLQLAYRTTRKPVYELLSLDFDHGLARLPEPSAGDIFLDFESDPFVEEGGLEYLLGYVTLNSTGDPEYSSTWAFNRADERRAFESFVDSVMKRRERFPDLHIYHFSQYETTALKRLMGRYATREDEMDQFLRARVFVDLHGIARQAIRASVEKYSLKDLEMFFGFERKTDLRDASRSLRKMECALELNDSANLLPEVRDTVEAYNREDCISTLRLRNWLEGIRHELVLEGKEIRRPPLQDGDATEAVDERRKRALALMERLLRGIPDDPAERSVEEQGRWLLAHLLEWHRREEKAPWWEYFRLRELTDEERLEDRSALSGLEFLKRVGGTLRSPIDRYRFPAQDTQVREGDELHTSDRDFGRVDAMDSSMRTLDVKKRGAMADIHPNSVFMHKIIRALEPAESLFRLGSWVADHGIDTPGPYQAACDLLLQRPPRRSRDAPTQLYRSDLNIVDEARRLVTQLDHGVLPIQGPPGAGKTFTAARMICTLLHAGKKVGVTAVSHKVIRKLLEETLEAAGKENLTVACIEKVNEKSEVPNPAIPETMSNRDVLTALEEGEAQAAAGTAWLWSRPEFAGSVDVLFVDEAGQMSLADVLAVSQAAYSVVLLGDPQQLEQPLQGTHPPGVAVSALEHVLGKSETMPVDLGLFLGETWRLSPAICHFTSELFYDNRLNPCAGVDRQQLTGPTRFAGSGLWFVPVAHDGNQSSSDEEADAVKQIVGDLLQSGVSWVNMKGEERRLEQQDILIVAPYNAQVFNLADRLPKAQGVRIGTVDKFQGQEAPVVIYSMATSSPEDAPRGLEFLYSANRFNVATSRAPGAPASWLPVLDCSSPNARLLTR